MQVCTSLQTDNHAITSPLSFLQAGCPSCRPTNSIKALKALFEPGTSVDIGASAKLELVDKFSYLGDMLSVDADADAVEARI